MTANREPSLSTADDINKAKLDNLKALSASYHSPAYQRITHHLIERSLPGTLTYPVLWGLLWYVDALPAPLGALFTVLLTIVILARATLWLAMRQESLSRLTAQSQRWLFISMSNLSAVLWSGLLVGLLLLPLNEQGYATMLILIAALCSGGVAALSPSLGLAINFLTLMLLPATALLFLQNQGLEASLVLLFWLYMLLMSTNQHRQYLQALHNALELEAKNKQLQALSQQDGLTKLANRRYFEQRLHEEWRRAKREQKPLCLLMLDIDHFKRLNDTYGHLGGDEALRQLAAVMSRSSRRPADLAGRYGGEEFVFLMPATDLAGARQRAEQLRATIEKLVLHLDNRLASMTVSIGLCALIPDDNTNVQELIARADSALYQAKANGRNQIRTSVKQAAQAA